MRTRTHGRGPGARCTLPQVSLMPSREREKRFLFFTKFPANGFIVRHVSRKDARVAAALTQRAAAFRGFSTIPLPHGLPFLNTVYRLKELQ